VNALELARELAGPDERIAAANERLSRQRQEVDRLAGTSADAPRALARVSTMNVSVEHSMRSEPANSITIVPNPMLELSLVVY
jgi:hypothetical protein